MRADLRNVKIDNCVNVTARCPHCGHIGTFLPVLDSDIFTQYKSGGYSYIDKCLGIRKCPNQRCNGHLFFIINENGEFLADKTIEITDAQKIQDFFYMLLIENYKKIDDIPESFAKVLASSPSYQPDY